MKNKPESRKVKSQGGNGANQWKKEAGANTLESVWNAIDIKGENDCWNFKLKSRNKKGYGRITISQKTYLPHRVAYQLKNGNIENNLMVLHKCNNPLCCNPNHLYAGSHQDNMIDAKKNGKIGGWRPNSGRHKKIKL